MPPVDIPVNTPNTATVDAKLIEYNGFAPTNVIHTGDDAAVRAELALSGVLWDAASITFELKLRVEGNPYANGLEGPDYVFKASQGHNGQPWGSPYTHTVDVNIPANSLAVPDGTSQSYELTLEIVVLDDNTGQPHGMAGFVDLGEMLVFAGPNF